MAQIDELPLEVVHHVLSYLDLADQLRLAPVSRRWRQAVEDCVRRRRQLSHADFSAGGVTNKTLQKALSRMPALRSLNVKMKKGPRRWLLDLNVDIVARHCPHLEEIDLEYFSVDDSSMHTLALGCPRLKAVTMPEYCRAAGILVLLECGSALRSLTLAKTDVTGECLAELPPSLELLSVSACDKLEPADLRWLARCTALRELDMSHLPGLRDADLMPVLAACTQLRRLTALSLEPPLALERCLPPAGLPALQHLDIGWSSAVTDNTLQQLTRLLPGLLSLKIDNCEQVTEAGLVSLPLLRELRCLGLTGLKCVADSILDQFHGSRLSELSLTYGTMSLTFTVDGLTRLVLACPSMKSVWLDLYNTYLVKKLVISLIDQLKLDRDVTVFVRDDILKCLTPPTAGPVHLAEWEDDIDDDDDDEMMEEEEDEDHYMDEDIYAEYDDCYLEEEEDDDDYYFGSSEDGGDGDNGGEDDSCDRPAPANCDKSAAVPEASADGPRRSARLNQLNDSAVAPANCDKSAAVPEASADGPRRSARLNQLNDSAVGRDTTESSSHV